MASLAARPASHPLWVFSSASPLSGLVLMLEPLDAVDKHTNVSMERGSWATWRELWLRGWAGSERTGVPAAATQKWRWGPATLGISQTSTDPCCFGRAAALALAPLPCARAPLGATGAPQSTCGWLQAPWSSEVLPYPWAVRQCHWTVSSSWTRTWQKQHSPVKLQKWKLIVSLL